MQELERAGHKGIWEKNIPGQGTEVAKALGGDVAAAVRDPKDSVAGAEALGTGRAGKVGRWVRGTFYASEKERKCRVLSRERAGSNFRFERIFPAAI